MTQPALFLSHGAPTVAITPGPSRGFLANLGAQIEARYGKPRSILIASAHYETPRPALGAAARLETIHDFFGFPDSLYKIRYAARGDLALARRARALLAQAGFDTDEDHARGLDHGAWIPLALMWPDASIPIAQISIQPDETPAHHFALGQALKALREEGCLIIGSGSAVHNLRDTFARMKSGADETPAWARGFIDWIDAGLVRGDQDALLNLRTQAAGYGLAHPSDEHFLPFFFAMGAGGARPEKLFDHYDYGSLGMQAWAFAH